MRRISSKSILDSNQSKKILPKLINISVTISITQRIILSMSSNKPSRKKRPIKKKQKKSLLKRLNRRKRSLKWRKGNGFKCGIFHTP